MRNTDEIEDLLDDMQTASDLEAIHDKAPELHNVYVQAKQRARDTLIRHGLVLTVLVALSGCSTVKGLADDIAWTAAKVADSIQVPEK